MTHQNERRPDRRPSRRNFLHRTCATAFGSHLAAGIGLQTAVHARGRETLRVGLVGCGSRGTGAAANAMKADKAVRLVALADMFEDKLQASHKRLKHIGGDAFDVDRERCFTGFDAYKRLLQADVDVVLLATPPHFRPMHLKAAVDAHCPVLDMQGAPVPVTLELAED